MYGIDGSCDEASLVFWIRSLIPPHSPTLPKRARGGQHESNTSPTCASAAVQPPQPLQVSVPQRNDIGTYSAESIRQLGNEERLWLYNNAFRPDPHHAFHVKEEYGKKRSFQYAWMKQFPWLCYLVSRNGGFCLSCVLSAKRFLNLGQLVTSPMTNFTRAKVTLIEHDKQSSHKMANQDTIEFISQMEKGRASVRQLLQSKSSASIVRNRAILKAILKAIVFCGRPNISLRGHCEQRESDSNPGNLCFGRFSY